MSIFDLQSSVFRRILHSLVTGTIIILKVFKEIADHMPQIYNSAKISVYYILDNDNTQEFYKQVKKKTPRNGKTHGLFLMKRVHVFICKQSYLV